MPVLNLSVADTNDDGSILYAKSTGNITRSSSSSQHHVGCTSSTLYGIWLKFTGLSGLSNATINSATLTILRSFSESYVGTPEIRVYAEESNNPQIPVDVNDYDNGVFLRTKTTEFATISGDYVSGSKIIDVTDVIQELVNTVDPSAIQLLMETNVNVASTNIYGIRSFESGFPSTLDIDYEPAADPDPGEGGSISVNVAFTRLMKINELGAVISNDDNYRNNINYSSDTRIIEDSNNPNTIGNPTIKRYLELEAASNHIVTIVLSQN